MIAYRGCSLGEFRAKRGHFCMYTFMYADNMHVYKNQMHGMVEIVVEYNGIPDTISLHCRLT